MNPVKSFIMNGVRWALRFSAHKYYYDFKAYSDPEKSDEPLDGYIDHATKKIWVSTETQGVDRLETIIHEATHAACPWMREWLVLSFSKDMARLLWRLGYRNVNEDQA